MAAIEAHDAAAIMRTRNADMAASLLMAACPLDAR